MRFLGQEKTAKLLGGWSPLSCKDKFKKIKNWLKNQSLLSIYQKKELETTPALDKEGPVASTSSQSVQRQSQRISEKAEVTRTIKARPKSRTIGTDLTHKGTGSQNQDPQPWMVFSIWPDLICNSRPSSMK
ncbi:hypothetical protein O181_054012 [Austropuccinia psidii MF-1]|uniref:Uncharacterized protein n=1 Tax=Austropuccinia psidii MF-1 TaxID=1389203 RepID=A0A9Q3E614_9BASI|nr:hypothetical protein [Austropuccinia psidii MF-1]